MKLPKTIYRAAALIAIAVSVIGFVMSPVSAAAAASPQGDPAGMPAGNFAPHHVFNSTQEAIRLQTVFANLSQQGVDVSQAEADLTAGNLTAAFQWLMAYHQDNPGSAGSALNGPRQHMFNTTQQTARLQAVLTNLTQQGVDVSQAQSDLTAGNFTAVMQDLMAIRKDNPNLAVNGPGQHTFNSTQETGSAPDRHYKPQPAGRRCNPGPVRPYRR